MNPRFEANGWQAVVADQFTFSNLRMVAQAICNFVRKQQSYIDNFPPRLVIGYDSRFMGEHFAMVAAEVVVNNGLDVFISDRAAPTPVISWMIADQVSTGAIMITGANESAEYNGVKFITSHMAIASEDTTQNIEREIEILSETPGYLHYSVNPGEKIFANPKPAYFDQVRRFVDVRLIASVPMAITVDYLYGISSGYLHEIFRECGGVLTEIQNSPHSDFGSLVPVLNQENLAELQQVVAHSQESLGVGLAIDGDGCHMQAVDQGGMLISHDQMFGLLLDYLVREKEWEGGIVKPNRQNDFAEQVAALHGLTITYSATTDFRNITSEMVHELAIMASDGLGGYAFQGHIMERDGILASLLVLEMIAARKKNLNQLIADLSAELSAA